MGINEFNAGGGGAGDGGDPAMDKDPIQWIVKILLVAHLMQHNRNKL